MEYVGTYTHSIFDPRLLLPTSAVDLRTNLLYKLLHVSFSRVRERDGLIHFKEAYYCKIGKVVVKASSLFFSSRLRKN